MWTGGRSVSRTAARQPSDTGGVTQPYFSCVFTKLLKVASASLRLKDFFDLPAFLQIRPCGRGEKSPVRSALDGAEQSRARGCCEGGAQPGLLRHLIPGPGKHLLHATPPTPPPRVPAAQDRGPAAPGSIRHPQRQRGVPGAQGGSQGLPSPHRTLRQKFR